MSGARLTYNLDDAAVLESFKRLRSFSFSALLDEIGQHFVSETTNRFKQGTAPDGSQWLPSERAKPTLSKKGVKRFGKTLVDTGRLRDSITFNVLPGDTGVEIGTDVVYGAIQQFGGKTGRNHATTLPARPFLGLAGDDEQVIEEIIFDHLQAALR